MCSLSEDARRGQSREEGAGCSRTQDAEEAIGAGGAAQGDFLGYAGKEGMEGAVCWVVKELGGA